MTAHFSRASVVFGGFWWRLCLRGAIMAALAGAANLLLVFQAPHAASITEVTGGTIWSIALVLALYVLLLSLPFVPGAEIGLALLVGFGSVVAWPVYLATVLALSIAFAAGRFASQFQNSRPLAQPIQLLKPWRDLRMDWQVATGSKACGAFCGLPSPC